MNDHQTGRVFNIQKFSLHDGPGIRDLLFLKGCPLRCQWCSNPESQSLDSEIFMRADRCLGSVSCGECLDACPLSAITLDETGNNITINRSVCDRCGQCALVCPSRALELVGREMTVTEVLEVVEKDAGFHFRSGGGITVSGGEPLAQAPFVASLLQHCRGAGMDTALETCGYGTWEQMEQIGKHANLIFFDLKSMGPEKHKVFTGVSNGVIKDNLRRLATHLPRTPLVVRTPVIPGFNDSTEDIAEIAAFAKTLPTLKNYELLAFHKFGMSKYGYLGRSCRYSAEESLAEARMEELRCRANEIVQLHPEPAF